MPPAPERVLVVALSARALCRSARRAGFVPLALDAFADLDLRRCTHAFRRVALTADWRFEPEPLLAAARELAPPPIPLVFGSGFERAPQLLARLAAGRPLFGTDPADLARARDPFAFAALCRELGIPHPEIRADPPPDPDGWLAKRYGGAGGGHVRPARTIRFEADVYFQREVAGVPVSVLVAGDGTRARALGFARQITRPGSFRFVGVDVPLALPRPTGRRLARMAEVLAGRLRLRGLGSVDAMLDRRRIWILELNPRPTGSWDAWELVWGRSLFALHVAACAGRLPRPLRTRRAASSRILFADRPLAIPEGFRWPTFCRDIPPAGTCIPAGGPVCTVLATACGPQAGARLVEARARMVYTSLSRTFPPRTHSGGWTS